MADQDKNVEFFLRSVDEKFIRLKGHLQNLVSAIGAEKLEEKGVSAKQALASAQTLTSMISAADQPGWLSTLIKELDRYTQTYNTTGAANRFLQTYVKLYRDIESYRWNFERAGIAVPIKFEDIFKEQYNHSKLGDVFETLIQKLEEIVLSGEVDSIRAIDALNKLIATIRSNARGSYFQSVGAARFIHAVFRNYLREQLKELPGIGPLFNAVEKTIEQMDFEMEKVDAGVKKKLEEHAFGEVLRLPYEYKGNQISNK